MCEFDLQFTTKLIELKNKMGNLIVCEILQKCRVNDYLIDHRYLFMHGFKFESFK